MISFWRLPLSHVYQISFQALKIEYAYTYLLLQRGDVLCILFLITYLYIVTIISYNSHM